ncbi:hypothetical protein CY34DRAFT_405380 [Suillus luteus UH-Slu-Lm8-n1]|uniref:Uncharacterized protein n=1 Tax=Suillus luteus UH-Slu-Lm8-n1 TaxID=930992 RepID=A0A0C9ZL23_9AGAM|nr:hypothetical protein CY34DRAFT_405380 [Suillus luteus UH-Slu-Lm8-n1]
MDMIVDSSAPTFEPGELPTAAHSQGHSTRGRGSRRRGGRGGRGRRSSLRESQNSDAMSAFTRFFRAEAEASKLRRHPIARRRSNYPRFPSPEELAIRKEAHAFNEMIKAERKHRHTHHHSNRSPHLSLDNRGPRRPSSDNRGRSSRVPVPAADPPQTRTTQSHSAPPCGLTPQFDSGAPRTAAEVISAACAQSSTSTPFSIAPNSPNHVVDPGSDVATLIAEAEQMDLEAEARRNGFSSTEDMFAAMHLQTSQVAAP